MRVRRFRSKLSGPAALARFMIRIASVQVLMSFYIDAFSVLSLCVLVIHTRHAMHSLEHDPEMIYVFKLGHGFMGAGGALKKVHFRVRHFAGVFTLP